jgi:7,8-dihydropterin-6-yl-methyl-4-(beta-D-ribofuranosyl)aminobenzene 5'-phosphate synthase
MTVTLREVDRVEITTVIDNHTDLLVIDDNEVVQRVRSIRDKKATSMILAEHGFSALFKVQRDGEAHTLLFDAGLSPVAVPFNLEALGVNLSEVEGLVLSHGHIDHFGGLLRVLEMMPRKPLPLVLHPAAFTPNRFLKFSEEFKIRFPELRRSALEEAGARIVESTEPYLLGEGHLLFLGEIPRTTDFEKGMPLAFYEKEGVEYWDPLPDDTALVAHLKGKGLVVLSGCAHSGIVNTVTCAREVTGVKQVHAIMGGFHLSGPAFEPIIERTIEEIGHLEPDYVIPTHCTGRKAIRAFEEAMPANFIYNLSGTKFTFKSD